MARSGSSFEVASFHELDMVISATGIPASEVLYSNTVKPPSHITAAWATGLFRFAFDSESELRKLATHAPGCSVYARLAVADEHSLFPLSKKFGTAGAYTTSYASRFNGFPPPATLFVDHRRRVRRSSVDLLAIPA